MGEEYSLVIANKKPAVITPAGLHKFFCGVFRRLILQVFIGYSIMNQKMSLKAIILIIKLLYKI